MSATGARRMVTSLTLLLTVLLVGCVGQERVRSTRTPPTSTDTVKILSVSPTADTVLRSGQNVPFRVEVEYTLETAQSATITLVIQQGEADKLPLANETRVVQKGSGKLVLEKDIAVPETNAIQVFTPLSPQGATSTTVVDTRAYAVEKR